MVAAPGTETNLIKALNHPLRRQILDLFGEGIASPKELAAQLGVPLSNVSYHVGILRDLGLIEVVRETPRRGATEHHYQATTQTVAARQLVDWLFAADRMRPRGWRGDVVELDDAGEEAVRAALEHFWTTVDEAQRQSAARLSGMPGEANRRSVATILAAPETPQRRA